MPPRRKRPELDVVGLDEIAVMFNVSKQRASQLMDQRINPKAPDAQELARGRVWYRPDVIDYGRRVLKRTVVTS